MAIARKFIQMGYTRARRYANYPDGRKYNEDGSIKERQIDAEKPSLPVFSRIIETRSAR